MADGWTIVEHKKRKPRRAKYSSSDEESWSYKTQDAAYNTTCDESEHTDNAYSSKLVSIPITKEFGAALQKARQGKGWTRAQLAKLINEKESLIQSYENAQGLADFAVINKLNSALGVSLPKLKKQKIDFE